MKLSSCMVLTLAIATGAQAEQVYVSDKLVVSVYAEANQESDKVTTLDSGDAVESLEKAEGFTHVRLADGREGWVKSSYLNAQTPAIVRLKELEKERASSSAAVPPQTVPPQVTEELRQLREQNAALRNEVGSLKQAAANAPKRATEPREPILIKSARTDSDSQLLIVEWSVAVGIAAGLIGFALGYRTLATRIQRKYGNLRIY